MLVQCSPLFRKLSLKFLFLPLFTCAFCFWCAVGRAPGYLLNNLAVEKIRTGNPKIGNPILASYAAKGPFPYRGPTPESSEHLRTGPRSTSPAIGMVASSLPRFTEGKRGVPRKSSEIVLELLKAEPDLPVRVIAERIRITQRAVEKQIASLRRDGRLRRVRPARALATRTPAPAREPCGRASMVLFAGEGVPSPNPTPRDVSHGPVDGMMPAKCTIRAGIPGRLFRGYRDHCPLPVGAGEERRRPRL